MSCRGLVARGTGRTTRALTGRMGVVACAARSLTSSTARSASPVLTGLVTAASIPFETSLTPLFRSARVHNPVVIPISWYYDITQNRLMS